MQPDLPGWLETASFAAKTFPSDGEKVAFAIALAARNVAEKTGGPFGAAVFDGAHRVVAVGVNRVIPNARSTHHAEVLAVENAQSALATHDLAGAGSLTLASSAQPCVMCFGVIYWSGIARLLFGAPKEDVEQIAGFDEGPLVEDWVAWYVRKGIAVDGPLLREQARAPLRAYAEEGEVY